jgi:hypothetical protein
MDLSAFNVIAIIAIAFLSLRLFLALFPPSLPYRFRPTKPAPPHSSNFLRIIAAESDAQIYEGIRHDGIWSVVGSTNFANRSFGLNDEVDLAVFDEQVAARLEGDFARHVEESVPVSFED